ncbi:MAG: uracil-DNA glycosylase, partial [Aquificaceae bacterium]|nr:uracil-DNA glycosylase [Aquificaceae bacterium]
MRGIYATLLALSEIGFDSLYLGAQEVQHAKTSVEEEEDREKRLRELYETIERERKCILYEGASGYVFGEGNPYSLLLFVGEAPGEEEDQQKRPFVGRAGRYLNQKLEEVGLKREEVYITNVVKSRPPGNRKPTPKEMQSC